MHTTTMTTQGWRMLTMTVMVMMDTTPAIVGGSLIDIPTAINAQNTPSPRRSIRNQKVAQKALQ
jgi:hypothetical protein